MNFLIDFVEKSSCFESMNKLKLILFALNEKPATFAALKITPKNIGDKFHFEKHLKKFIFKVDNAKSFEEIVQVKKNNIIWSLKGTWYGYDLFKDRHHQKMFRRYVSLVKKRKNDRADLIAGQLYGYPSCCIKNYIKENNLNWLKKKYSYYQHYKKLHDMERKFPFITYTACSMNCKASRNRNIKNRNLIKKNAPDFYKEFAKKRIFKTDFIVEGENNILTGVDNDILWTEKKGCEYNLVSKKPYDAHYYLYSHLSKDKVYPRGSLLSGRAVMQHNYADLKITKLKKVIPNLVHIRQFKLLGRKY